MSKQGWGVRLLAEGPTFTGLEPGLPEPPVASAPPLTGLFRGHLLWTIVTHPGLPPSA